MYFPFFCIFSVVTVYYVYILHCTPHCTCNKGSIYIVWLLVFYGVWSVHFKGMRVGDPHSTVTNAPHHSCACDLLGVSCGALAFYSMCGRAVDVRRVQVVSGLAPGDMIHFLDMSA